MSFINFIWVNIFIILKGISYIEPIFLYFLFFGKNENNHPANNQKHTEFQFEKKFNEGIIGNSFGIKDITMLNAIISFLIFFLYL